MRPLSGIAIYVGHPWAEDYDLAAYLSGSNLAEWACDLFASGRGWCVE